MDQVRPLAATAAPAPIPPKRRRWLRISLVIQQVEERPARLFTIDSGPYSLKIAVALTGAVIRRLGILALAGLSVSHPVVWRLIVQLAKALAQ